MVLFDQIDMLNGCAAHLRVLRVFPCALFEDRPVRIAVFLGGVSTDQCVKLLLEFGHCRVDVGSR